MPSQHFHDLYWEYRERQPCGRSRQGSKKGGDGEPHSGESPITSNPPQGVTFDVSQPLRLPIDAVHEPQRSAEEGVNGDLKAAGDELKIKNTFVTVDHDMPSCPRRQQTSPPGLLRDSYADFSARANIQADSTRRHGDYSSAASHARRRIFGGNTLRHSDYNGSASRSRSAYFFGESPAFFGPSPVNFHVPSPAFFGASPDSVNSHHPDFFPRGSCAHRGALPQVPEGGVPPHMHRQLTDYYTHNLPYTHAGTYPITEWWPQYDLYNHYGTTHLCGGLSTEALASAHDGGASTPTFKHHSQLGYRMSADSQSEHNEGSTYRDPSDVSPEHSESVNYREQTQASPEHNARNDNHAQSSQSNVRETGKLSKRKSWKSTRHEPQSGAKTWTVSNNDRWSTVAPWPAVGWSTTETWSAPHREWWRPLSTEHQYDTPDFDARSYGKRGAKDSNLYATVKIADPTSLENRSAEDSRDNSVRAESWQHFAPWKQFKSAGARRRYWRDVKVMKKKMEEAKKREEEQKMEGKDKRKVEKDMKDVANCEAENEERETRKAEEGMK